MTAMVFSDAPSVVPVVPAGIAESVKGWKSVLGAVVLYGLLVGGLAIPFIGAALSMFFIS